MQAVAKPRAVASRHAPPLALALLSAALYLSTLCRSVYWYDSAEYVTAAYTLGVPHPPGYPLYTLIAHAFTWLSLPVALSVNLLSALAAVLALLLLYAVARELGTCRPAAAGGAAVLATAPAFWFNATVAEVYTPGLCFTLGVLWLALRAHTRRSPRHALAAAAVAGLGLGVHYSLATCGLGYVMLVLMAARRTDSVRPARIRVGVLALQCTAATLAGASVFVYVAVRGFSDSAIPNYGSPPTLERWLWLLSGGTYAQFFGADLPLGRHVAITARHFAEQLGALGLCALLLGAWALGRRSPWPAAALGVALLGNLGFFLTYRVEDSAAFLLPAVALGCLFAAAGVDQLAALLRGRVPRAAALGAALSLSILPAFAGARAAGDFARRDLSDFRAAFEYGERVSSSLPRGAVLLNYTTAAEWKYDAVFGMYMQHVLGRRPDVVVVKQVGSAVIDRLLSEGRPVFMYARVPELELERRYRLEPAGELLRVTPR